MSKGSDSFHTATTISLAHDYDTYVSEEVDADEYDMINYEDGENNDNAGQAMLPSIWWAYTPENTGVMTVDTAAGSNPMDTVLEIFTGSSLDSLTRVEWNDDDLTRNDGTSKVEMTVDPGKTYYIKYEIYNNGLPADWGSGPQAWIGNNAKSYMDPPAKVCLRLTGPRTVTQDDDGGSTGATGATGPSGSSGSSGPTPFPVVNGKQQAVVATVEYIDIDVYDADIVYAPYHRVDPAGPADVYVEIPDVPAYSTIPYFRAIPSSIATVDIVIPDVPRAAQVAVTDFSPADGTTIPTVYPTFTFYVKATEDFDVIIQMSTISDFSSSVISMTQSVEDPGGDFSTIVTSPTALNDDTTYYWRYRIVYADGTDTTDWNGPHTLNVDQSLGSTVYTGSWIIGGDTGDPVIWFATPGRGQPGDHVTIFGLNIAGATGVTLSGKAATIVSTATVAADTTQDPIIDMPAANVTVEHDEVVFIVPDVESPGGDLTVEV